MLEHIVQMGPMLVLAGLMAGWVAEAVSRAGGYGFIADLAISLVGSVMVGTAAWMALSGSPGMLAMFGIGAGGAVLAVAAQRSLWRSPLPLRARG